MASANVNDGREWDPAPNTVKRHRRPIGKREHVGEFARFFRGECTVRGSRIKPLRFAPTATACGESHSYRSS